MLRILFCVIVALTLPAYGQGTTKSKSVLNAEVSSTFPDNTTGAITPANVRAALNDFIASWNQALQVNAQTGTTYTIQVSDYGKMVTFNNAGAIAVTLPQANGSFSPFNVFITNLGTGTVTITPQGGSTIGGAGTLSVPTNDNVIIVSDS